MAEKRHKFNIVATVNVAETQTADDAYKTLRKFIDFINEPEDRSVHLNFISETRYLDEYVATPTRFFHEHLLPWIERHPTFNIDEIKTSAFALRYTPEILALTIKYHNTNQPTQTIEQILDVILPNILTIIIETVSDKKIGRVTTKASFTDTEAEAFMTLFGLDVYDQEVISIAAHNELRDWIKAQPEIDFNTLLERLVCAWHNRQFSEHLQAWLTSVIGRFFVDRNTEVKEV